MSGQWSAPAWLVVGAIAVLVVFAASALVALLAARRTRAALVRSDAEAALVARRLEALERRLVPGQPDRGRRSHEVERAPYVVTLLGEHTTESVPIDDSVEPTGVTGARNAPPTPGAFAEAVLRESVIRSVSLAYGVRRALAPEVRDRVRGEMRRELKRARRARRVEQRVALRDWRSRQRSALPDDPTADPAATPIADGSTAPGTESAA